MGLDITDAKSTALMGEVDVMIMGVASLVFLLQMKSLMQRQLSQLAPKTDLEESSLPLAADKKGQSSLSIILLNVLVWWLFNIEFSNIYKFCLY